MNSVLISNKERNNSTLMDFIFVVLNAYATDVESNGKQIQIYQSFNDFPNDKLLLNQGII